MRFTGAALALLASSLSLCRGENEFVDGVQFLGGYCLLDDDTLLNDNPEQVLHIENNGSNGPNDYVNFKVSQVLNTDVDGSIGTLAVSFQNYGCTDAGVDVGDDGERNCVKINQVPTGFDTGADDPGQGSCTEAFGSGLLPAIRARCVAGFSEIDVFLRDSKINRSPEPQTLPFEFGLCDIQPERRRLMGGSPSDVITDCMVQNYSNCSPSNDDGKKCWYRYKLNCNHYAGGDGDPHITTWTGEKFDFHGECDLVLIRNPKFGYGLGLNVHGRTKIHDNWSYFETVAVQIGHFTLEVQGADKYWINGSPDVELPHTISGYKVEVTSEESEESSKIRVFTIHVGDRGENIFIRAHDEMMWVQVWGFRDEDFVGSLGLLGAYGSGHKVGRDGVTIFEDPNNFGQEWQVTNADPVLFHKAGSIQYPEKCKIPENAYTSTADMIKHIRGTAEGERLYEMAKKVCTKATGSHTQDCIFDVMVTKRLDLAAEYQEGMDNGGWNIEAPKRITKK